MIDQIGNERSAPNVGGDELVHGFGFELFLS